MLNRACRKHTQFGGGGHRLGDADERPEDPAGMLRLVAANALE